MPFVKVGTKCTVVLPILLSRRSTSSILGFNLIIQAMESTLMLRRYLELLDEV